MPKNILMPESFVANLDYLIYMLRDYELDCRIVEVCNVLDAQLRQKMDAMEKREAFSKYMAAPPGSAERELLRRIYIDKAGLHRDWCSDAEISI